MITIQKYVTSKIMKPKPGGGPQRLDHLRGELSYSQKLKKL
jgi:hypothetical protein